MVLVPTLTVCLVIGLPGNAGAEVDSLQRVEQVVQHVEGVAGDVADDVERDDGEEGEAGAPRHPPRPLAVRTAAAACCQCRITGRIPLRSLNCSHTKHFQSEAPNELAENPQTIYQVDRPSSSHRTLPVFALSCVVS